MSGNGAEIGQVIATLVAGRNCQYKQVSLFSVWIMLPTLSDVKVIHQYHEVCPDFFLWLLISYFLIIYSFFSTSMRNICLQYPI